MWKFSQHFHKILKVCNLFYSLIEKCFEVFLHLYRQNFIHYEPSCLRKAKCQKSDLTVLLFLVTIQLRKSHDIMLLQSILTIGNLFIRSENKLKKNFYLNLIIFQLLNSWSK